MMKRGDIYFANLDPTVGSEIQKKRPVLIVSNNASNKRNSIVTILPITSNVSKVYTFEVFLPANMSGLKKDSKIQCHQIRTISKLRMTSLAFAGEVDENIMEQVQTALELHLGFV